MNCLQAEDYFSAYFEGWLDSKRSRRFEAYLDESSTSRWEYYDFQRAVALLKDMPRTPSPPYITDSLLERIDEHKRSQGPLTCAILSDPVYRSGSSLIGPESGGLGPVPLSRIAAPDVILRQLRGYNLCLPYLVHRSKSLHGDEVRRKSLWSMVRVVDSCAEVRPKEEEVLRSPSVECPQDPHADSGELHSPFVDQELREAVRAALDALPKRYGTVLYLYDIIGLSYEDISDILGISLGKTMSRINRARIMLKDQLTGQG